MTQQNENALAATGMRTREWRTDRIKALNLTPEDIKAMRASINARFGRLWGKDMAAQTPRPAGTATSSAA